jgi:hypothetical protein
MLLKKLHNFLLTWKPIKLCWWFMARGKPIPKYFIGTVATAPSVTTNAATDVADTTATLNGDVTSDGGANITARGFVYSSSDATPTIGEGGVTDTGNLGGTTGTYSTGVTSLTESTQYWYQAYAINNKGTSYGGVQTFTTEAGGGGGRIWSSGFEINSTTSHVEWSGFTGSSSIVTSPVRSGTYAYRTNPTASTARAVFQFSSAPANTPDVTFYRIYLRIASAPGTLVDVARVSNDTNAILGIRLNTDRTLELWNEFADAQIGSDSSALDLDTWYRIEFKLDATTIGSTSVEAKIDGAAAFASGTPNFTSVGKPIYFVVGNEEISDTHDIYFDDVAINTDTGDVQNSYPGEGKIIHLVPNAAGDNADWTRGGADSGANWSQVDENPPNGNTDYVLHSSVNESDDHNITNSGLGTGDAVTLIAVGVNYNTLGDPTSSFILRLKADTGGTVTESENLPTLDGYFTNATTVPRLHPITSYSLPGTETSWSNTTLDTAQIGYKLTEAPTVFAPQITATWALVEYVPGGDEVVVPSIFITPNKFWGS